MLWRWMTTSMLLERQVEQPVRLDHFQALVHQRGRVDGDLGAHAPGGVLERLGRRHVGSDSSGRSRNAPPDAVRAVADALGVRLLALQALPDGAVLAVDREQRRARPAAAAVTRWPAMISVSLLASATALPAARAAMVGGSRRCRWSRPRPGQRPGRSRDIDQRAAPSAAVRRSSRGQKLRDLSLNSRMGGPPPARRPRIRRGASARRRASGGRSSPCSPAWRCVSCMATRASTVPLAARRTAGCRCDPAVRRGPGSARPSL